jgi:hypothetical protein
LHRKNIENTSALISGRDRGVAFNVAEGSAHREPAGLLPTGRNRRGANRFRRRRTGRSEIIRK